MDTALKFKQLVSGIDLKGKKVLDVGCNLGMMCQLATEQGATAVGIDIDRGYIKEARTLFPKLVFSCLPADKIYGNFDVIIASAMLHYVVNLPAVLHQFARCAELVVCDVWLSGLEGNNFMLSYRDNIYIPSKEAFIYIAKQFFGKVEERGEAISPDISRRYIFHLSEPSPTSSECVLIYGGGDVGKTSLANTFFNYEHIQTDHIFGKWKTDHMKDMLSVAYFANLARGKYSEEYVDYFVSSLKEQLEKCINRDVVIEGYDLLFWDLRDKVLKLLKDWAVTEISL